MQKEAMTDEEVEKWEGKIKDSLLRRDTTLNSSLQKDFPLMPFLIDYPQRNKVHHLHLHKYAINYLLYNL